MHYACLRSLNRFACVAALVGALAIGAVAKEPDPGLPPQRPVFRVGVAALSADRVAVERRFVAATFPLLLYESIRAVDARTLTDQEVVAYGTRRLEAARRDAARTLSAAVERRDRLAFERNPSATAIGAARDAVAAARLRFDTLASMEPTLAIERERPVGFVAALEAGRLLPAIPAGIDSLLADDRPLRDAAARDDLDALVFGYAEQIAGYVVIDIYLYHAFLATIERIAVVTRLAEEIAADAADVADAVASSLLGRPWGAIDVIATPSSAAIRVDSALIGLGSARIPFARPGDYELHVSASGRAPVVQRITLEAGEAASLRIDLTESTARPVRLQSSPSGANVYVDSVWVGSTPVTHRFAPGSSTVRMTRDGYLESRFVVDQTTASVVSRALLPDSIDWGQEIRRTRADFYRSLTWFVVSVPATLVLWGGYQSILGVRSGPDILRLSFEEDQRMVRTGNILYWSALGGVMVNAALLANVVLTIVDYVAVGEGFHNQ
ncbi:MAG: PEGA domain-containing protein [Spirochaetaceae bacterium]|nr:MAG: PEGA domain-containing protein [Spirochaetaceae bacterium]